MAKSAYQLWQEDQARKKQVAAENAKTGNINFKEASKASRVQYSLPGYEGKSKDKSYKWETDLLKPLSIKKYGRSYNDKFSKLSREQGIDNEDEYRRHMDFEEDRKIEGRLGHGAYTQKEILDGIFANMEKNTSQSVERNRNKEMYEPPKVQKTTVQKEEVVPKKKKNKNLLDDLKDIGRLAKDTLNPFDDVSVGQAAKNYANRNQSKTFSEIQRGSNRAVDSASFGVIGNLDKKMSGQTPDYLSQRKFGEGGGTDMLTTGLGYLVPGVGGYKALNSSKAGKALTEFGSKSLPKRLVSEAAKGSAIGAGISGAEVAAREGFNPTDYNWKDNAKYIGMNTAIGGLADPLLYGAGKGIAKGFESASNRTMRNLLPDSGQVSKAFTDMQRSVQADNALPIKPKSNYDSLMPNGNDITKPNYLPKIEPKITPRVEVPKVGKSLDEIIPAADNEINNMRVNAEQPTKAFANTQELLPPVNHKQSGSLPSGVQAMQNEIVPLRAPSGKQVKPISRQELLNNTRKNLGVTIRHGRLGNVDDNVSGYFKVNPEVIRTKNYGDIGVISHEIGHHLDKQFKLTDAAFDNELMKLGKVTSGKGYTPQEVREEGLAEFIRLYLSDPQKAVTDAPMFSQHFENVLPKKVKQGLLKTQGDVDRWIEQGPEMRLRGKIDRTGKEQVTVGEKVDRLYSQFIDKFDRLKKVEKQVTGQLNSAEQSLYKKARLSVGAPKKAELILHDFKDILKPIEKYGYNMKDVSDYATAVHAKELETLDIESGMTKEEIEKVMSKFNTPEMNQVHQGLMKYNNKLLDMLKDGGILSAKAVEEMKKKYPNYVPFYRFFEDDIASGLGGGKGFANLTNPVKRLKGSTRDVIDPLESMVKNTFAVVNAVEKNKVGLELSRLADIEGAGQFVERLHGAQDVKKEHIVTVFENGEKVQYQLDKDLYEAIQQLDEDTTNKVIQFLSVPTGMLRAGATLTPEFMLRNPIRDQFQAFVVSNNGYFPIIDLPVGAWKVFQGKALNKDGLYKQWVREGGGYGNYLSQDRNYLRETLSTLKKEGTLYQKGFKTITNPKEFTKLILHTLQSMSEFTEEATKLGEFRRAMKKGATPQEAAFQSRDLMDFGRVGTDMRQWNRAVAFLNANLQGKDKIARAFKQNPVRTTIKAITGVTLPAIGAYVMMDKMANEKQKETYANTPKWMKDTFFLLPIPGTDELARIPKPFDLAPVFANPVEQVMDYIKQNDPDSWSKFIQRQAVEILKIPHMLTGLTPIIENMTNHSFFTGGPVVPRRDQDLLPQDQYGPSTSLVARTVGNLTGEGGALSLLPDISPYKTDNLIRGYGAGLGKYATAGADNLLEALKVGKTPPQEAKKWSELPVMNAFTVDSTGGGQIMTDFYDTIDKLTKERNSAKRNQEGYEEGDDVNYARVDDYKYLTKVSRDISDLRNQYRAIQSSYDLTPQEKRYQLDELDRQMNSLAREALIDIGEKTK
ncbi:hypothetical protein J1P26_07460 [Neobacillus sp. MM2021_6]|uniref:LPD38 domain-containing protein n=1 Tax=Bacillaceae TaxID=186817 RepID=UPI0014084E1D|nr:MULTISPECIES: LPD38 domain-containing protein [Bacillaceae]MBO0959570.1 hypothetical protein [Neobacillus sp. MM2021_6]NHC17132.1 hypothetical protein [Bacillus sp. MM2020_4]